MTIGRIFRAETSQNSVVPTAPAGDSIKCNSELCYLRYISFVLYQYTSGCLQFLDLNCSFFTWGRVLQRSFRFRVYDEIQSQIGRGNSIVVLLSLCIISNGAVNWNKRLLVIQQDGVTNFYQDLKVFHWHRAGKYLTAESKIAPLGWLQGVREEA